MRCKTWWSGLALSCLPMMSLLLVLALGCAHERRPVVIVATPALTDGALVEISDGTLKGCAPETYLWVKDVWRSSGWTDPTTWKIRHAQ